MTTKLPPEWEWLLFEEGPRHLVQALKRYGTLEVPGIKNSETILDWALELRTETHCKVSVYQHDSTAWCGLYAAIVLHKAGWGDLPVNPLWALNWASYGAPAGEPQLGDILVFTRQTTTGTAGHVGFYVGEGADHYWVLGGNQSDKVCIAAIAKKRLWSARTPPWQVEPPNRRVIHVRGKAAVLSTNEA